MSAYARERAAERIAELAGRGHDLVSFWSGCSEALATAVPHYVAPCWYTLDPASLLITSHVQDGLPELPAEWLVQEYEDDGDVNKLVDVARTATGISTLHDATGGDPSSTRRWHENMRYGGDQELIAALRSTRGEVWGALGLYREPDRPRFDRDDLAFVRSVAAPLADGARRSLLIGQATDPDGPDAPSLALVRRGGTVASTTPGTDALLADMPDGGGDRLPSAVLSVAASALSEEGSTPTARVRGRSGRWLELHGVAWHPDGEPCAAVIIEGAHPARIAPLLMAAYELTEREQQVTRLVLQGRSTDEITQALTVSPLTVQEHLKNIFDKTGVRSRRDLTGKIFFAHYEPRLRDNEARTTNGVPLRGEPMPLSPGRAAE
jgi:DNA-binding CsgD family transcriptional regulator